MTDNGKGDSAVPVAAAGAVAVAVAAIAVVVVVGGSVVDVTDVSKVVSWLDHRRCSFRIQFE